MLNLLNIKQCRSFQIQSNTLIEIKYTKDGQMVPVIKASRRILHILEVHFALMTEPVHVSGPR